MKYNIIDVIKRLKEITFRCVQAPKLRYLVLYMPCAQRNWYLHPFLHVIFRGRKRLYYFPPLLDVQGVLSIFMLIQLKLDKTTSPSFLVVLLPLSLSVDQTYFYYLTKKIWNLCKYKKKDTHNYHYVHQISWKMPLFYKEKRRLFY